MKFVNFIGVTRIHWLYARSIHTGRVTILTLAHAYPIMQEVNLASTLPVDNLALACYNTIMITNMNKKGGEKHMDQLKAVKELATMLHSDDLRRVMICTWLEDINWHSECAVLAKGFKYERILDKMERLNIARNKAQYTATHYKFLLDENIVSEQDEQDIEKMRNGMMVFHDGDTFTHEMLNDYKFALECAKSLSLVWGWGMSGISQETLIQDLEAIISMEHTAVGAFSN